MKELQTIIASDLYRYYGKKGWSERVKNLIKTPGFKYTYVFRYCQYHYQKRNRLRYFFYKLLLIKYRYKFGYEIPFNTPIGPGFSITHLGGIAINPEATIGKNVSIFKGITIGTTYRGSKIGAPTIGNHVWIGSNAVVVGKVTIGNDVLIAPGSYVNFDVPDHSIVIGNPGKIISKKDATDGYIVHVMKE